MATSTNGTTWGDLYSRITARIVEQLERGVLPWLKPWHAEHAAGRISRPLLANGTPYCPHQMNAPLDKGDKYI